MQREEGTIFRDPDTRTPPDSANVGRNLKKSATKENIMNIIVSLSHQFYFNQHQSYFYQDVIFLVIKCKASIISVEYHFVILMDTFCSLELRKST